MSDFENWKSFNYQDAAVYLWVFKKSTTSAQYRAWHVRTDSAVEKLFRDAVVQCISETSETINYSPISQNNEASCLTCQIDDIDGFKALLAVVNEPETEHPDITHKNLAGAAGYLVKFKFNQQTIYAVRKTAPTWKPKVRNSLINTVFKNGELSIAPEETFSFNAYFDFYLCNQTVFIKSKKAFESTTSEKKCYKKNFDDLCTDTSFLSVFSDIEPLKKHVGVNSIHLRRIVMIQLKQIYQDPNFISRLKQVNTDRNYGLNFDSNGKIIICENTVKTVMNILLDHRLISEITQMIYDVPDAQVV